MFSFYTVWLSGYSNSHMFRKSKERTLFSENYSKGPGCSNPKACPEGVPSVRAGLTTLLHPTSRPTPHQQVPSPHAQSPGLLIYYIIHFFIVLTVHLLTADCKTSKKRALVLSRVPSAWTSAWHTVGSQ